MRPTLRRRAVTGLLAGLLAAGLPACGDHVLLRSDPETQEPERDAWQATEPLEVPSLAILWDHALAALDELGYTTDDRATDFAKREIVTRWVTRLAPTRYEGKRHRAHVRLVEADGGRWIAQAAVLRQENADLRNPMNPVQAQWERQGSDPGRAGRILFQIRIAFDPEARAAAAAAEDAAPR
jgi:hypothetical protein